jgi:hypothetical protein
MVEIFNEKLIISGKNVEYYQYQEVPVIRGYLRKKRKTIKRKERKEKSEEKTAYSVNRTRTEIRRLVDSNSQLCKFLTLTFKENLTDLEKTNYLFNIFIQKMKKQFPEFQYLAIVEFQKRGAVHYHLLCNLRYVQSKKIEKIWKHGFIKIKRISNIKNIGAYVCKYLQKEMFDKRMFGKKKYFRSQDLENPVELVGDNASFFIEKGKDDLNLIWEKEFENEYRGKVLYQLYNYKN